MLYVFHVDTGNMMTFDMNLALETVAVLKKAIANKCSVYEDKQVLLISGGESLSDSARVCSYSAAGTDTSPIFLFSKSTIESSVAPQPKVDYGADYDMKERVESCLDMEPAINTVVARAELANQLHEMATQQLNVCEKLVHDQHLQHQGWRAVVANLEDIAMDFGESVNVLNKSFTEFAENREHYGALLKNFDQDLGLLSSIPLLPNLINLKSQSQCEETNMSLLQWISQKDEQFSLEQVAEQCLRSLEQFDESSLEKIEEEVKQTLESVNNKDMKEIKGLEERLYGLEKLMCQAKKLVSEQSDLSQALYQNQQRASNLRDPSIFPDLCKSHQKQLQVMLHNHQQLRDIRRRCVNAKRELSENLHLRLRWIMFVEKKLTDVDSKIMIYRENLRRLKRHLEIIEQVNLAPKVYLSSVVEVVRRKEFSRNFTSWSLDLVKEVVTLYDSEMSKRQQYAAEFSGHFLRNLFPGMGDVPPPFATEPPKPFDVHLPNIDVSDLKMLKNTLPQLSHLIELPSNVPFPTLVVEDTTTKAKQEELKAFKASLQAEKQIIFNETLSQITKEKDEFIQTLQGNEKKLLSTLESINVSVSKLKKSVKSSEDLEALENIERMIASSTSNEESMLESFVDLPPCVSEKETIAELQNVVKCRDFEISKLQQKISELSITGSAIGQTDRVAVLSCEAGDVVLVCYDERYESYIVFTLNPILHFVHTESVEALKLNSGPGEAPRSWALAEITDKEYCQAKKAQNRYNVPVSTRFYRVKAKPWSRANVLKRCSGDIAQSTAFVSAISSASTAEDTAKNSSKMATSCIANLSSMDQEK